MNTVFTSLRVTDHGSNGVFVFESGRSRVTRWPPSISGVNTRLVDCLMWIISCLRSLPESRKRLRQTLHSYGFSPVWMRSWIFNVPDCTNVLWQTLQAYGRSPVWIRRCACRPLAWVNVFLQILHSYCCLTRVCRRSCSLKLFPLEKNRSQRLHLNGASRRRSEAENEASSKAVGSNKGTLPPSLISFIFVKSPAAAR